jgi:hypothetical protein
VPLRIAVLRDRTDLLQRVVDTLLGAEPVDTRPLRRHIYLLTRILTNGLACLALIPIHLSCVCADGQQPRSARNSTRTDVSETSVNCELDVRHTPLAVASARGAIANSRDLGPVVKRDRGPGHDVGW